jgi:hypothetical protein
MRKKPYLKSKHLLHSSGHSEEKFYKDNCPISLGKYWNKLMQETTILKVILLADPKLSAGFLS